MTNGNEIQPGIDKRMVSGLWGGRFEDAMNELFSSKNIKDTAHRIIELERKYKCPYEVGKFNKDLLPESFVWPVEGGPDAFKKDFMQIPDLLRQRLSDVLRANIHSTNPLPVFYRTSENVDQSHDIILRPFVYNNIVYLGVLYLCANRKTPT